MCQFICLIKHFVAIVTLQFYVAMHSLNYVNGGSKKPPLRFMQSDYRLTNRQPYRQGNIQTNRQTTSGGHTMSDIMSERWRSQMKS